MTTATTKPGSLFVMPNKKVSRHIPYNRFFILLPFSNWFSSFDSSKFLFKQRMKSFVYSMNIHSLFFKFPIINYTIYLMKRLVINNFLCFFLKISLIFFNSFDNYTIDSSCFIRTCNIPCYKIKF